MIDRPDQLERLMERLGAALPILARPTPELQTTLQKRNDTSLPADCRVTWVSYAGDEGGIGWTRHPIHSHNQQLT